MKTKLDNIKMIIELSNANGISGFEDEVCELAKKYLHPYCEVKEDKLRNVYAYRKQNNGKRLLVHLDAHEDEVGFLVQALKPNGTLRFINIGGWSNYTIPSSRVRVKNESGEYVKGIIGATPPHFMQGQDRNKTPEISNMYIDVGAKSLQDLKDNYKIDIASPVVPDVDCYYDAKHDTFLGKAFDCRIGCASLIKTIDDLNSEDIDVDVVATLSSQEEVGERGIQAVMNNIKPDISIVFEGCPADDTFQENYMIQTALGQGPMLRHYDTSIIANPRYMKYALDLARKLNIPVQESVRSGGGNNGAIITLSNQGIPTIVIGVPVRYIHSHYGYCTYSDFENASKLALAIIKNITKEQVEKF